MTTTPDGFDAGAEAVWEAKKRGETILKADLARIVRTAYQAFQIDHPPPKEAQPPKGKLRARNPLFDALAEATGSVPTQLTKTGAKTIGVALAEIQEASPEVTPEEIHHAAKTYKRLHKDWPLTATALSKHWGEVSGGSDTESRKRDPYLPPPENWQDYAMKKFPGTLVHVTPWADLSISVRSDILSIIP